MAYFISSHDYNCAQNELTRQLHDNQTDRQTNKPGIEFVDQKVGEYSVCCTFQVLITR